MDFNIVCIASPLFLLQHSLPSKRKQTNKTATKSFSNVSCAQQMFYSHGFVFWFYTRRNAKLQVKDREWSHRDLWVEIGAQEE